MLLLRQQWLSLSSALASIATEVETKALRELSCIRSQTKEGVPREGQGEEAPQNGLQEHPNAAHTVWRFSRWGAWLVCQN